MVKIYKIFYENDPNVVYVGKTSRTLKTRLGAHIHTAKKKLKIKTKFYNWLRENGYENLKISVICEVENDKGDESEIEQIRWHKENGFVVKNQTEGGTGVRKGYKHTEEVCDALSKRNILLGTFKGEKNPFFGKNGKKNHKSVEIHQYSLFGEYIKTFESQNLAAKEGFGPSGNRLLSRACKTGEIAYGYLWSTIKVEKLEPKQYRAKIMEESDVNKCFELYQKGFNFSEIENIIGFSRSQITRKLKKKFGVEDKHKKKYMNESDIEKAFELYQNGASINQIEKMIGFSKTQIWRKLKEKYNLQIENYLLDESVIVKAAKLYESGVSFNKIHKELRKEMKISRDRITLEIKKYLGIDKK